MFKGRKVDYVKVFEMGGFIAVTKCGRVKQWGDMRGKSECLEGQLGADFLINKFS